LVEAVEKSDLVYMMAENYCYKPENMMVLNMAHQGLFGEITYLEGAYIHDTRNLTHDASGNITWRGQVKRDHNGILYPTHSLGPVAQWIKVNKEHGDELDFMTTFTTKSVSSHKYYEEVLGTSHPGSAEGYWDQGDTAVTLIKTKGGVVINLRQDSLS